MLLRGAMAAAAPATGLAAAPEDAAAGIRTASRLDDVPPHFVVRWVAWDSAFRAAGLLPNDRIVAVDGRAVVVPSAEDRPRYVQTFVGQVEEAQGWAAIGRRTGDRVRLSVRRRAAGTGWVTLDCTAAIDAPQHYTTPDGRQALGAGGPDVLANEGYDESWAGWYEERLLPMLMEALGAGWDRSSWVSRVEYARLLEQKPRMDTLRSRYPGAFSTLAGADFDRALASAAGRRVLLPPDALRWRRAEDDKRDAAAAAARAAWAAWQQDHGAQLVDAFPAPDPLKGDLRGIVGKLVVLPPLRPQDWVEGADRSYFVAGERGKGWYAADAAQPASLAMLRALGRWRGLVSPQIDEQFVIAARILPTAMLVVIGEESIPMIQLEPVAAFVGEAMFVDLTARSGAYAAFAGQAELELPHMPPPALNAAPAAVLAASIAALKAGDLAAWRGLFADFGYQRADNGAVFVTPWQDPGVENRWEDSRRLIMDRLYDATVAWVDDPVVIADGTRYPGASRVEEIGAIIDHVGRFDGPDGPEYRVFNAVVFTRQWTLLRLDGGPWRIASGAGV